MKTQMNLYALILINLLFSSNLLAEKQSADIHVLSIVLTENWEHYSAENSKTIEEEVKFYSCSENLDTSNTCDYRLSYGEKTVSIPYSDAVKIQESRKYYSMEKFSGGIKEIEKSDLKCRLGGPARGLRMYAYPVDEEGNLLPNSHLQPILDIARNCLYQVRFHPINESAKHYATESTYHIIEIAISLFAE